MSNLAEELKNLFVNDQRSTQMMYGECGYDPHYVYEYTDRKTGEKVRNSYEIDEGYAKNLDPMGVKYENVNGGEGQGDTYYTVWKFTRDQEEVFFSFNGWYASYNGAEFTDVREVKPKQVTRTEYM